ncbi:MAG: ABC transporter permease [Candidatus Thermoplasmatota archaeon]|jgi:ABC-2 type transport system permease protein|nr:ABC transporter permease [Candidatus Thermoplasmatota archaeon]MCL5793914.1 ABC transporter permease [Candidatus Thermoplasmatota archaeon]
MKSNSLKNLRALESLMKLNGMIPIYRRPLALVAILSTPFSFLFFVDIFSNGTQLLAGSIGGLIFTMINAATMLQSDLLFGKIDLKFQQMVSTTGISPLTYVLGMASGDIIFILPGAVFFLAAIIYLASAGIIAVLLILASAFLTWLFFSLLSYLISRRVREMREIWPISVIFGIVFAVLPPIYYSIYSIPVPVRYIAYLVPTTFAALIIKGAVAGSLVSVVIPMAIYALETLGMIFFATRVSDWRQKNI